MFATLRYCSVERNKNSLEHTQDQTNKFWKSQGLRETKLKEKKLINLGRKEKFNF